MAAPVQSRTSWFKTGLAAALALTAATILTAAIVSTKQPFWINPWGDWRKVAERACDRYIVEFTAQGKIGPTAKVDLDAFSDLFLPFLSRVSPPVWRLQGPPSEPRAHATDAFKGDWKRRLNQGATYIEGTVNKGSVVLNLYRFSPFPLGRLTVCRWCGLKLSIHDANLFGIAEELDCPLCRRWVETTTLHIPHLITWQDRGRHPFPFEMHQRGDTRGLGWSFQFETRQLITLHHVLWWVWLVPAVYPAWLVRKYLRRRRWKDEGKCPGCGYDLRGLPEPRCPECGRPPSPGQSAVPFSPGD